MDRRQWRHVRVVCGDHDTRESTNDGDGDGDEDGEEDNVAYTPICPLSGIRGEKTKWLSGAGFSPYAHALLSASPERVPSVEQRRHTNPYGYPGRRAEEE